MAIRILYMKEDKTKILKVHIGRVINMSNKPFHEVHNELIQDGWVHVPLNDTRLAFC